MKDGGRAQRFKIPGEFSGPGAYEEFKKLASVFYETRPYYFAGLKLIGDPKEDEVKFEAEFWESV